MKDIKTEKILFVNSVMNQLNYVTNETVRRRINHYQFQRHTTVAHTDKYIRVSTETKIKGVYDVLLLFPCGISEMLFEFA